MPDPSNTDLIEFNDWTLRVKASSHTSSRLLFLIHGLTGDEDSMWIFTRDLPSQYSMVAPRAPHKAEPFGYSWRPIQPGTFGMPTLGELVPAASALIRLIDGYQASAGIEADDFDVIGFSQGAVMSSVLAFCLKYVLQCLMEQTPPISPFYGCVVDIKKPRHWT